MKRPGVCVLRTAGTNCDMETAFAFEKAGGRPELVHINRLISRERSLREFAILAFPGGFTYGDDIAAGKVFANEVRHKLTDELRTFIADGRLIIGICNGFQILVKAGLLPGNQRLEQEATLSINDSARFEDRWVHLRRPSGGSGGQRSVCVWTRDLPEVIYLPVAHGEGKFIASDASLLKRLNRAGQVVFRYCDAEGKPVQYPGNPNGSQEAIAGICDATGRILGLMPHPERHMDSLQHPRQEGRINAPGDGLRIIKNGVAYACKHL